MLLIRTKPKPPVFLELKSLLCARILPSSSMKMKNLCRSLNTASRSSFMTRYSSKKSPIHPVQTSGLVNKGKSIRFSPSCWRNTDQSDVRNNCDVNKCYLKPVNSLLNLASKQECLSIEPTLCFHNFDMTLTWPWAGKSIVKASKSNCNWRASGKKTIFLSL